jgi:N-acetylglucosaminyldiphosphoundecaprenol N-acetyl-beta-D-mannosaminyltransferase
VTVATPTLPARPARAARGRVHLLGVGIDRVTRDDVARRLDGFVRQRGAHQVVTVNMDFLSIARRNEAFRRLVNDADLVVADGTPVRWAARYYGSSLPARITGPDLIEMGVAHSIAHGSSLFFLGAAPGVAARAADRLRERFGAFSLAGVYSPPFGPIEGAEAAKVRRLIADTRPDFLFVAFGCPKQDFFIREHADLGVPVAAGIGGSFEFLSGAINRAPGWAQRGGLEWAFRLWHEPRRLAKRYLVDDVLVAARLIVTRFTEPQMTEAGR